MHGQRLVWLLPTVVVMATSVAAQEQVPEPPGVPDSNSASGMARIASTRDGEGTSPSDARDAPSLAEPEAAPAREPQPSVITAKATTGPDAGPAVMLRCLGADGVFSFGPGSDDFVAWAFSPGPIDLTQPVGLHYRFGVVPPLGEQCRIFREPFPEGVVPPAPP